MRKSADTENSKPFRPCARSARLPRSAAARRRLWIACVLVLSCCLLTHPGAGQDAPSALPDYLDPETVNAAGALPLDQLDVWTTFRPRFSFVYDAGKGVGYRDSFTSLEAFVPLAQPSPNRLWFADFRGLFNKEGAMGGNIGLGRRQYCSWLDGTLGAYLYYDARSTAVNQFQQISPGFELLTDHWDFRANGYLSSMFDERQVAPNEFREHFLYIDRFETGLSGADMELGLPVSLWGRARPRVVGGCYYFSGPTRGSFWGWKARVEGDLTDAVSWRLSVQDDPVFDTTVNFAVAVRFSGGALLSRRPLAALHRSLFSYSGPRAPHQRLADPVYRLQNVVVDHEETLARDPDTGDPIDFLHVLRGGPGPGTFEAPYNLLTDALADTRYLDGDIDVIYVRSGPQQTVTHTGNVTFIDNTQLLSNGPVQTVATQFGDQVLPLSGNDTEMLGLPIIQGQVTMGNSTKLSGFEVDSPAHGVVATAVSDVAITNNLVASAPQVGVMLSSINSTDNLIVTGNDILKSGNAGVKIDSSAQIQALIEENEISESGGHGIEISVTTFRGAIDNNRIVSNAEDGMRLDQVDFAGTINDNTIDRNEKAGINIFRSTLFTGEIRRNTITGNFQGTLTPEEFSRIFNVDNDGSLSINKDPTLRGDTAILLRLGNYSDVVVSNNQIGNFNFAGVSVVLFEDDSFTGEINDNSIDSSVMGVEFFAAHDGVPPIELDVRRNKVTNGTTGIFITGATGSTERFVGDIEANTVSDMTNQGIYMALNRFEGDILDNIANGNGVAGIDISLSDDQGVQPYFRGNISGNSLNRNRTQTFTLNDGSTIEIGGHGLNINAASGATASVIGDISNNVASRNEGWGIIIAETAVFDGDITANQLNRNDEGGMFVAIFQEMNGNISKNQASHNKAQEGIRTSVPNLNGSIFENILKNNFGRGLVSFTSGTLNGDIRDNVVIETIRGGGWLGSGLSISGGALNGNISGNIVSNNDGHGMLINEDLALVGDIANNSAKGNGAGGIVVDRPSLFRGDIRLNEAYDNGRDGILVQLKSDFEGNISENTATSNGWSGIAIKMDANTEFLAPVVGGIVVGGILDNKLNSNVTSANFSDVAGLYMKFGGANKFTGDIRGNEFLNNENKGLFIKATSGGNEMKGDISNNNASLNDSRGIDIQAQATHEGNVSGNRTSDNDGFGFYFVGESLNGNWSGNIAKSNPTVGSLILLKKLTGDVTDNRASDNDSLGMQIGLTGDEALSVNVLRNGFSSNNSGGTEFGLQRSGNGDLTIPKFNFNRSTNESTGPPLINFDLIELGAGEINIVEEIGNIGTVQIR